MLRITLTTILTLLLNNAIADTFLFFHGGPGYNSNPEEQFLKPLFEAKGHNFYTWDEPSALRTAGPLFVKENAYENLLKSSEEFLLKFSDDKIILIGHSFGTFPIYHLAKKYPELIERLVVICPALNVHAADVNIFKAAGVAIPEDLKPQFDMVTLNTMLQAAANPDLATLYWNDMDKLVSYWSLNGQDPQWGFDFDSFVNVRLTMPLPELIPIETPTLLIFGANDIIVKHDEEILYDGQVFQNREVVIVEDAAHYPHAEQTEIVMGAILK